MRNKHRIELPNNWVDLSPKVNDRVEILRKDIAPPCQFGVIKRVNGAYIYVQPDGFTWQLELYQTEIRVMR